VTTGTGPRADIGLVGLAVMGQNLVMNMADHGFTVAVYNRTTAVTDTFLAGPAAGAAVIGCATIEELAATLKRPRRVMLMVKAGAAVDAVIDELAAVVEPGDIIIDGGNSLFTDSIRRTRDVEARGLLYIGTGVSGGEEGARHGPSIMPGGSMAAWPAVQPILQAVAAKTADGTPCCDWVGSDGAGHYVKMVHNGIEYGDMQVTAEAFAVMRAAGMTHQAMSDTFRTWGKGVLGSYLIDITTDILAFVDEDGSPLVEHIHDAAGQKGTGKWAVISSMELAQPLTLVAEAVFARIVSSLKDQRVRASAVLVGPEPSLDISVDDIRDALYASKIVSYAQGFMLLRAAAADHGWDLDLGRIASLWREGCIIRARFLDDITAAFDRDPGLENLLLDPFFASAVNDAQAGWRRIVATAINAGIPVPAYSSALAFFDGYRSATLSANLIQAQRDYFGAHTYERTDRPRGEVFHTNWTGQGGATTAGTYTA
jgi:6-phosphogluconate dehydrogenase